jgi:hypothetical protein
MDWLCLFAQALMRNFLSSFQAELEEQIDLPLLRSFSARQLLSKTKSASIFPKISLSIYHTAFSAILSRGVPQ